MRPFTKMTDNVLIQTYNKVFVMSGNTQTATVSPPVTYIIDRVKTLLSCQHNVSITTCARNQDDTVLLELLFKAVAGDFTSGSNALQQDYCRVTTDPITGYLAITDKTKENSVVLTIILVVVFVTFGYMIYHASFGKKTSV